jgi:hypothetical protein
MEMKSDAPKYPVSMVRAACKAIKEIISTYTQPVYAVVDEEWKSAPRFLNIAALSIVEYRKISRSLEE